MIRKVLFAAATLLIAVVALKATNLDGYVKVYWDKLANKIKKAPSLEDRVAKLKVDITRIDDEMKAGIGEEIRLEQAEGRLKKELDTEKEKLTAFEGEHQKLKTALTAALEAKKTQVSYDDEQMSLDEATSRLATLNTLVPAQRKSVDKIKEDEKNVTKTLEAVRKDLRQMRDDKVKFEALVKNLELRIKQVRQAERENKVGVDRGRSGQIEADIAEIEEDLGVRERFVEKEKEYGLIEARKSKEKAKGPSAEEVLKAAQKVDSSK
jgi:chromosome segregation ATPase